MVTEAKASSLSDLGAGTATTLRVTTRPSGSVVLARMAPLAFTVVVLGMLLFGVGRDIAPSGELAFPAGRSVAGWLAAIALLLVFAHSLLRPVTRLLRGQWPYRFPARSAAVDRELRRRADLLPGPHEAAYREGVLRDGVASARRVVVDEARTTGLAPEGQQVVIRLFDDAFAVERMLLDIDPGDLERPAGRAMATALDRFERALSSQVDVAIDPPLVKVLVSAAYSGLSTPRTNERAWPATSLPPGRVALLYPMTGEVSPTRLGFEGAGSRGSGSERLMPAVDQRGTWHGAGGLGAPAPGAQERD